MTDAQRIRLLAKALLFYAKGRHMCGFEFGIDGWDAPDEPNWLCPPLDSPEEMEQLMLEDGGVAAAALRHVFGRATTKYEGHTSRGHPQREVCPEHRVKQPCPRCQYRLGRIAELMRIDPPQDSDEGKVLIRLVAAQEQAERWLMRATVSED